MAVNDATPSPTATTPTRAKCPVPIAAALLLAALAGCPPPTERVPLAPTPIAQTIANADKRLDRLDGTLQARGGHASGYFTDADGATHRFDCDAKLLVKPPLLLRFDLTILGRSYMLFGSNDERYWMAVKPEIDTLWWGSHELARFWGTDELITRPDLIIEALGLSPLPQDTTGDHGPVQRVTHTQEQLLFIDYTPSDQGYISREYWISRYDPRIIDRIVFRDVIGRIVMNSRLSNYKPLGGDGPLLPHRVDATWPTANSHMLLTVSGWKLLPGVGASHPGFAFPLSRGEHFAAIINVDAELQRHRAPTAPIEQEQPQPTTAPVEPQTRPTITAPVVLEPSQTTTTAPAESQPAPN